MKARPWSAGHWQRLARWRSAPEPGGAPRCSGSVRGARRSRRQRRAVRGVRLRARRAQRRRAWAPHPRVSEDGSTTRARHVPFGRVGSRRRAGFTRARPARSSSQRLGRSRSDRYRDRSRAGCLSDARDLPHLTWFRSGTVQRARRPRSATAPPAAVGTEPAEEPVGRGQPSSPAAPARVIRTARSVAGAAHQALDALVGQVDPGGDAPPDAPVERIPCVEPGCPILMPAGLDRRQETTPATTRSTTRPSTTSQPFQPSRTPRPRPGAPLRCARRPPRSGPTRAIRGAELRLLDGVGRVAGGGGEGAAGHGGLAETGVLRRIGWVAAARRGGLSRAIRRTVAVRGRPPDARPPARHCQSIRRFRNAKLSASRERCRAIRCARKHRPRRARASLRRDARCNRPDCR